MHVAISTFFRNLFSRAALSLNPSAPSLSPRPVRQHIVDNQMTILLCQTTLRIAPILCERCEHASIGSVLEKPYVDANLCYLQVAAEKAQAV
jgi:hypothetical protein